MTRWFKSDNTAPACAEIMTAIAEANRGHAAAYGDDEASARLDDVFGEFFGTPVRVFPVATGTAANAIALATLVPPYGAVFAHDEAHILRDECGAPEFMTGGARISAVPGFAAKLTPDALAAALDAHPPSVHTHQPAAVSVSQCTECGTVYQPDELAALAAVARRHGLKLHMDGARFANALVAQGCHPGDLTWRAGVDVLSFGATKNGALAAEAVVFFDLSLVRDFELRRKRSAHLLSKLRYVSAQLLAYVETGVWRRNAAHANALAQELGAAAGTRLLYPVEANEVFVQLDAATIERLRAADFAFYDWGAAQSAQARFVVSWNQDAGDVAALAGALRAL
jgi:threonine aldolase